jgi:hypothetical protein
MFYRDFSRGFYIQEQFIYLHGITCYISLFFLRVQDLRTGNAKK